MGKKDALTSEDWIKAGFRALVAEGAKGLRAEALARALGISKGSFYWHFADVPALKRSMIDYWYERATRHVIAVIQGQTMSGTERLRLLVVFASAPQPEFGGIGAEGALREWARSDDEVRAVARKAEAERLAFVSDCFLLEGFSAQEARWRAEVLYGCLIGLETLSAIGVPVGDNLERQLDTLLVKDDR